MDPAKGVAQGSLDLGLLVAGSWYRRRLNDLQAKISR